MLLKQEIHIKARIFVFKINQLVLVECMQYVSVGFPGCKFTGINQAHGYVYVFGQIIQTFGCQIAYRHSRIHAFNIIYCCQEIPGLLQAVA